MTKQVIKTIRNFVLVRFWAKEKETLTNLCEHFLKFQCIYRKFVQSCICIIGRKFYGKVGFWSEKSVSAEGVWRNDFKNQAYTFLCFDQKYTYSKYDRIWRKLSGVAVRGVTYCLPEGRQTRPFLVLNSWSKIHSPGHVGCFGSSSMSLEINSEWDKIICSCERLNTWSKQFETSF